MTPEEFEWEESEAKMLRNVDKKKRKLEKQMKELEDQLSNQQSYRRQLERDYQTINTTSRNSTIMISLRSFVQF
jgi:peptidoglycan hydrolase CwlO-like protein